MALRWSRVSPQLALVPAVAVTLVAFAGAIGWTIYMSFTASRRFPDYAIDPAKWCAPVYPPVQRRRMGDLARNIVDPRAGQCAGDRARLRARRDDREGEARRRVLPHDLPLSARGLADRHRHRLAMDVQSRARRRRISSISSDGKRPIQLARRPRHRHVRHHPRLDLARARLLHGADAGRPEMDQHRNLERGASSTASASGGSTSRSSSR